MLKLRQGIVKIFIIPTEVAFFDTEAVIVATELARFSFNSDTNARKNAPEHV
jgi:hypothetical protein